MLAGLASCAELTGGRVNIVDDIKLLLQQDGNANLTPDQVTLREEASRYASTRVKSALGGAVSGAFAGWQIARATNSSIKAGVAAGAAAGAFAGYAAGTYVAAKNQEAATTQTSLRTRIKAANEDAERYEKAATAARNVVASQKDEIARLNKDYASRQIDAAEYKSKIASLDRDLDALNSLINESQGNVEIITEDIKQLKEKGRNVTDLESARDALQRENNELRRQWDILIAAVDAVPDEIQSKT